MKEISRIIREFDKFPYKCYKRRRIKQEPTDSYFCQAIQLVKCMMRADALNLHVYPVRMEMTGMKQIPVSHVCLTDKSESEEFLVEKTLSQVCSTVEDESKSIIDDEIYTEESESECVHKNVSIEKDANNEAEYEEPMVTFDPIVFKEPIYFNIFKCGKNILNRLDTTFKRVYMATPRDKYYTDFFRTITYFNDRNGAPFSNEKIQYSIHRVVVE